jgi:hypothetical protein
MTRIRELAAGTALNGTEKMPADQSGSTVWLPLSQTPGGRLTLASGVPITESDIVGATTIFYTPATRNGCEAYDGSYWRGLQFSELSLLLDSNSGHTGYHQSGKNFFLGLFMNAGVLTFGSSVAWTGDNATGTGAGTCEAEIFQGRMVNKVAMTVRFGSAAGNTVSVPARQFTIIGGFRASADGQTEDSMAKRYVSNIANPTIRPMRVFDPAASWTYSIATLRAANANPAAQLAYFHAVAGRSVSADVSAICANSTATVRNVAVNIGVDSQSVASGTGDNVGVDTTLTALKAVYLGFPGIGWHAIVRQELGAGADTQTWYSNNGLNSGIFGTTLN